MADARKSYNYILSVRNAQGKVFGNDIGEPAFLKVPRDTRPALEHKIKNPAVWLRQVRDIADGLADDILSPEGDVLMFVHGYNNKWSEIIKRQQVLQDMLIDEGWKGVVISFDWPCADETLAYLEDRSKAAATAQFLVTHGIANLAEGQAEGCKTNVHLLGHSTGAYVIMEAFSSAQKIGGLFKSDWRIAQTAFIGGDVASDSLDADCAWATPMFGRTMRLTNYSNGFDSVLAVSNAKRLGTAPRVGRVGLTGKHHTKAVNVDCSEYFNHLDTNEQPIKVGTWSHSWHIGNPVWTRDFAMTIEGRYDRSVIPTRAKKPDGLYLIEGSRPPFEMQWRELEAASAIRRDA